jgi:hypothetical protein
MRYCLSVAKGEVKTKPSLMAMEVAISKLTQGHREVATVVNNTDNQPRHLSYLHLSRHLP